MAGVQVSGVSLPVAGQSPGQEMAGSTDPQQIWDAISQLRTDLLTVTYKVQQVASQPLNLSALTSAACPAAGSCALYASSTVGFALSGVNYWTITGLRQGLAEQANYKSNQADVITAYEEFFLGTFTVGAGDVMSISLASVGAPAALTLANITIRCELTPRNPANA